jgi:hypothetical protein
MLKVFASQKTLSGFSRMIPSFNSRISPQATTTQEYFLFSSPLPSFLSLFLIKPLMANLLARFDQAI